jgi:hypothetical protein
MAGFPFGVFAISMIAIVPIVAIHLLISYLLWRYLPRLVSLPMMAILSIATIFLWVVAGFAVLFYIALGSHGWGPGTPEENTYWMIWTGRLLPDHRDFELFVLIAISSYLLGILFSVAFTTFRRRRRKTSE